MATPYYGMIEEVWVILIDDDKEFVTHMTGLLKSHNYKVITVDTTSTTVSLLSKGNQKIDVMILNVHSSNLLSFALLAQAVALDIISLVVCDEFNELVAKKTLEDGAYLYLKKPFDKEIVKYLWQFVLSEKIQREKARKGSGKHKYHMKFVDISTNNIVGENKEPEEKNVSYTKEQSNNIHEAGNDVVLIKWKIHATEEERRKDYREWTEDLHARFMQVVHQLGEGRCYPKKILEVMNLPGLTRMQVASHLQGATYSGSRTVSSTYIGNAIINNYNLNVLVDNVTTYSSSAMVSDTYVGNVTINGLGATNVNANAQQHVGEPIMSGPRNTNVASYENYNLGPPSANLPIEQGNEFDQVYSDDQNLGPPSANLPNEQDAEFD
ncbi:two-component response regulator ARR2-like [Solanum stenotomum]|uniref:two-component response regulator ARR2-like n=1 Tax=Solanum stenotomum TaxID=172797 RepID=UPI0020D04014|nr:two-component response regulator ARR2-like [Solanum stenotomum]